MQIKGRLFFSYESKVGQVYTQRTSDTRSENNQNKNRKKEKVDIRMKDAFLAKQLERHQ